MQLILLSGEMNMKKNTIRINGKTYDLEKHTAYIHEKNWHERSIFDVYKNPSIAKTRSWYFIKDICERFNGKYLTVTWKNCHFYGARFDFRHNRKNYVAYFKASGMSIHRAVKAPVFNF